MIGELAEHSIYFGVLLSLVAYGVGLWLKRLTGWSLINPLFIAIVLVISTLLLFDINYDTYSRGADIINYLLTQALYAWRCLYISNSNCSSATTRL